MEKINLKIHKTGSNNAFILECIGEVNAGKASFSARDLEGYLALKIAYTPITGAGYKLIKDTEEPNTYHVSEDAGKTFTLSIEWVEVFSLQEDQRDDLKEALTGMPDLPNEMEKELTK